MVVDSGDHASILDGCILSRAKLRPFRHNRLDLLEKTLETAAADDGGVLVVVDGVFSMEGDVAPLPEITELSHRYGARVMVDEAHALGVLGARGAGASELFGVEDQVDLRMATFSKSLASCGGVIAGPGRRDRVPAGLLAAVHVHRLGRARPRSARRWPRSGSAARTRDASCSPQVLDNAAYLHAGLAQLGFQVVAADQARRRHRGRHRRSCPVVVGDDWKAAFLWKALYDRGVYVNVALHPAVPPAGALLRTSVMATHDHDTLDRALELFADAKRSFRGRARTAPGSWVRRRRHRRRQM